MKTYNINSEISVIARTIRVHGDNRQTGDERVELCSAYDKAGQAWAFLKINGSPVLIHSANVYNCLSALADGRPLVFGADVFAALIDDLRDEEEYDLANWLKREVNAALGVASVTAHWDGRKYVFEFGGGHCVSYDGNDWTPQAIVDKVHQIRLEGGPKDGEIVS